VVKWSKLFTETPCIFRTKDQILNENLGVSLLFGLKSENAKNALLL